MANAAKKMSAVLLTGHGGLDKLEYKHDVPIPEPSDDEVLIKLHGAGVNNTDINTRIGWYSKSVTEDTKKGGADGFDQVDQSDASWNGEALKFPLIQGADGCGEIVQVGRNVDRSRLGERVIIRSMQAVYPEERLFECITMGSEINGNFAQYSKARSSEAFKISTSWSSIELASIPCAYSTAENMLHRIGLGAERVLITGASGGVGSAAIQLAARRGAAITAVAAAAKHAAILEIGASEAIDRDADLLKNFGANAFDVVVDLVGGANWPSLIDVLRPGGRYITAGAIAGPIVSLDLRSLYLKDLTIKGSTFQERKVFDNLVSYIERDEIAPIVSKSYSLENIREAQVDFLKKDFVGKLVLIPPA